MPLVPPQGYLKIANIHRSGPSADRPAATDVVAGTLYFSTDTSVLERSDGVTWTSYSPGSNFQGFVGSEIEQGEVGDRFPIPGPQGSVGVAGAQGERGLQGPPGLDSYYDRESELYLPTQDIILPAEGDILDVAYSAGNFNSNAGTWTVDLADQVSLAYTLFGRNRKILWMMFDISTTSVSGGPTRLQITIPLGKTVARTVSTMCQTNDNGTPGVGVCSSVSGNSYIGIFKDVSGGAWANSTDNTRIFGQTLFPCS